MVNVLLLVLQLKYVSRSDYMKQARPIYSIQSIDKIYNTAWFAGLRRGDGMNYPIVTDR